MWFRTKLHKCLLRLPLLFRAALHQHTVIVRTFPLGTKFTKLNFVIFGFCFSQEKHSKRNHPQHGAGTSSSAAEFALHRAYQVPNTVLVFLYFTGFFCHN